MDQRQAQAEPSSQEVGEGYQRQPECELNWGRDPSQRDDWLT
jgi:hypothetical protein